MNGDRANRLQRIAQEMGEITREIGPRLIRLGHLRKEARQILAEAGVPLEPTDAGEGT